VSTSSVNWVDLVGFQHGPLHTGALRWLLDEPVYADRVAARLLGCAPEEARVVPGSVRREARAGGQGKRKLDLVFAAELTRQPGPTTIAVETKVDDACREEQLRERVGPDVEGVRLAVGRTGLQCKWVDLADRRRFGAGWRLCDLPVWAALLDELDGLPNSLVSYRDRVVTEHAAHEAAIRFVRGQGPAPPDAHDPSA